MVERRPEVAEGRGQPCSIPEKDRPDEAAQFRMDENDRDGPGSFYHQQHQGPRGGYGLGLLMGTMKGPVEVMVAVFLKGTIKAFVEAMVLDLPGGHEARFKSSRGARLGDFLED